MKKRIVSILLVPFFLTVGTARAEASEPLQVLLVEGQNNHRNWPETSQFMKKTMEKTGKFEVSITRTPPDDGRKQNFRASQPAVAEMAEALQAQWEEWRPDFSSHDVVLSNYNGVLWPEEVQLDFMEYLQNGGGFVVVHAANNAFSQWEEYQRMIGVGGWYGR
ncbi:MAG: ThuA domain-containing protein, partial [Opitutae bacterium]|nr:ThuA domain-containing protein [Opitutae bacterium]